MRTVRLRGKLSANQIEGDIVKTVGKAFPPFLGTGAVAIRDHYRQGL
ncbi:phage tail tip protein [Escherichia coli]